jgi:hypothetical protein
MDICEPKRDENGDLGDYLKCCDPFLLAEEFLLPRGKCMQLSRLVFIFALLSVCQYETFACH